MKNIVLIISLLSFASNNLIYAQVFEQLLETTYDIGMRKVYKDSNGEFQLDSLSIAHRLFTDVVDGKTKSYIHARCDREMRPRWIERKIRRVDTLAIRDTMRGSVKLVPDTIVFTAQDISKIVVVEKWVCGTDGKLQREVFAMAPIARKFNGKSFVYTKPLFWVKWEDIQASITSTD